MDRNPLFRTEWLLDPTLPDIHPYLLRDSSMQDSNPKAQLPHSSLIAHHSSLIIPVSAKNDMNIEYLKEKLFALAVGNDEAATSFLGKGETTIVTNARHHDALRRADAALEDVLTGLDSNVTGDFIAQDIRRSLMYLGEISGVIGVEDLLENIFSKFCIGK